MKSETALSPNATPVSSLALSDAMRGPSIAALVRETGRGAAIAWISEEVDAANRLCGGGMDQPTVTLCAELILDRFKFRTVNALRIALRDGLNSGKIFGKLTYPLIAEWLIAHEEAVEAANFQQHLKSK